MTRTPRSAGAGKAFPHITGPEAFSTIFGVSREVVDKLQLYAALLQTWQRAVNLVAPSTLDDIWHRHFADSAQILGFAPTAKSWIDLGSGGGFPGLVIAILLANQENRVVHLIESNGRKCAFLSEVARRTGAPAIVHEGRIEDFARGGQAGKGSAGSEASPLKDVDAVTSRALAPLSHLLGLAHGFFAGNTVGLFLKGRDLPQEIDEARRNWRFEYACHPSRTSGEGGIIEVRKLISQGDYSP
jgi:16S rRNA (guanine527-N7)-methyltransferase